MSAAASGISTTAHRFPEQSAERSILIPEISGLLFTTSQQAGFAGDASMQGAEEEEEAEAEAEEEAEADPVSEATAFSREVRRSVRLARVSVEESCHITICVGFCNAVGSFTERLTVYKDDDIWFRDYP
jgi:hypothetical protein